MGTIKAMRLGKERYKYIAAFGFDARLGRHSGRFWSGKGLPFVVWRDRSIAIDRKSE
jgi:hypothetical protein